MSAYLMVKINTKAKPPCVVEAAITSSEMLSCMDSGEAWLCLMTDGSVPSDGDYYQSARDRIVQQLQDASHWYGWLMPYLRDDDPLKLCHPRR